ncbi:flagellar hook-length control protein FliK [Marinobacter gudaonensis]|uniref:Flagellar hook-length control protein FliK n=1 Tax=Marinobacter gudaonensis TaxID=375760 RepID=A0A1I6GI02_9GAMM|nr:flagellar hook-length control protein FliK [Marinobacter gudaonensis]SFR41806.1 flagellar hook-length control protein FliK [Marinobacter gudaonensis]
MAQMVLPQTPAPGTHKDPGPSKSVSSPDPADRKSDFESVSKAEQQRLDRKQAERKDAAKAQDAKAQEKTSEYRPESPDQAKAGETSGKAAYGEVSASNGPQESQDTAEPLPADALAAGNGELAVDPLLLPLTFAELQSLVNPQGARALEAPAVAAGLQNAMNGQLREGGLQTASQGPLHGLRGVATGQATLRNAGVVQDGPTAESLKASLVTELGRSPEANSLPANGRFQSAMDLVSQQAAGGNNTARLTPETAAPLRGYATSIDVPVGHAEWGDKLVGKLSWLTARNMSVAEIHLTPPDMGPMEVKVRVQNEQASITVHSANPVVRDQLELNSHRLRDMLSEQGLSLAGFDVSDSPQQQSGQQETADGQAAGGTGTALVDGDPDADGSHAHTLDLSWKGEVDIFA